MKDSYLFRHLMYNTKIDSMNLLSALFLKFEDRGSLYYRIPACNWLSNTSMSEKGLGSMWYWTLENGPGWSTSTARMSENTWLPVTASSLMLRTYGAPINTGELSFTSVTLKAKFKINFVLKFSKTNDAKILNRANSLWLWSTKYLATNKATKLNLLHLSVYQINQQKTN